MNTQIPAPAASTKRWLFVAVCVACTQQAAPAAAPPSRLTPFDANHFATLLSAEIGDSVVAKPAGPMHPLPLGPHSAVALSFPRRSFDMSDDAGMRAFLGHVVPRARWIAGAAADSLSLVVQLEMTVPPRPNAPANALTRMSQDYRWRAGAWPADSVAVTK